MSTRVYVGGVSNRAREKDLERFFRKYGRLKDISMKNGYAFVEFDDYRDADDACYELSGKDFMGERITIELARGTPHGRDKEKWGYSSSRRSRSRERGRGGDRDRGGKRPIWLDKYGPPTRTDYRVLVENLSSRVSWQDLKDFMRQAGDVTYADAHKAHRNQGVVEFASYDDMKTAIEKLDDTELNGRRITITEDKNNGRGRRSRSRSRSKSRSRSRSRTRSRSRRRSRSERSNRSVSPRTKAKSESKSRSRSRSKSRSASRSRSRSKSDNQENGRRSRSKSGSRGRDRSDDDNDD